MTGLSRCGKQYRTFDAALLAAELRIEKGAKPLEVVGCGFCSQWHVIPKGSTLGQSQQRPEPFPPAVRLQLAQRDERCQRCGKYGVRLEAHHRRAKASGGSSARSHTQCACNGVLLCRGCHEWAHLNPRKARAEGWIVLQSVSRPRSSPIRLGVEPPGYYIVGDLWLHPTCEGGWNAQP